MNEYTESEKNEIRKNLMCSVENDFYSTKQCIEKNNIEDFNNMTCNISLYKLATENLLMHKKLNALEKEINQLKQLITETK
tara:strand:- start:101 stop:343 length:243 start_codon:yes stop_codon:yes gene_type:complete